jgi:hypothetical protein
MRIQTRQKAVAIYASQVFAIQADLIRIHMDPQEIAEMSQAAYLQEDPQLIIQALDLLKGDQFAVRVQVESDTLSDIDFQAERDSRMEYLTAISQFMKDNGAAMLNDPTIGPFLAQLLQFSLVGFKIGKKFEGRLDKTIQQIQQKLSTPQPPKPTPEEQKVQGELQLMQQEGQMKAQEGQQKLQYQQASDQMKLQSEQQKMGMEARKQQMDMMFKARQQQMDSQAKAHQHQQNIVQNAQKAAQQAQLAQIQAAQKAGPGQPPVQ